MRPGVRFHHEEEPPEKVFTQEHRTPNPWWLALRLAGSVIALFFVWLGLTIWHNRLELFLIAIGLGGAALIVWGTAR